MKELSSPQGRSSIMEMAHRGPIIRLVQEWTIILVVLHCSLTLSAVPKPIMREFWNLILFLIQIQFDLNMFLGLMNILNLPLPIAQVLMMFLDFLFLGRELMVFRILPNCLMEEVWFLSIM